jgi:transcriptional regulator with XRE-family HTH domain
VATRIRALAKARRLPLSHLADRAGVSRKQLWNVLCRRKSPTLAWLSKIAAALDVEVIEFLRDTDTASGRTQKTRS